MAQCDMTDRKYKATEADHDENIKLPPTPPS